MKLFLPDAKRLLIPANLDLDTLIENYPPDFKFNRDYFLYLINLLWDIPMRSKDLMDCEYVPLSAKRLQSHCHNYRCYLNYLLKHEVFETDNHFKKSEKCIGYRLGRAYITSPLMEVVITHQQVLKAYKAPNINFRATVKYDYLYQWFETGKISIDKQAALDFLTNEFGKIDEPAQKDYSKFRRNYAKVNRLEQQDYWFTVDWEKGKRLHTNFTSLNKLLKPFITYDGQQLVSTDVKNSQPFLSLSVLKQKYPSLIHSLISNPSSLTNPIMLVSSTETAIPTDVHQYAKLVITGQLYETLVDQMKREFGLEYFRPRWKYNFNNKSGKENKFVWDDAPERVLAKRVFFEVAFSKNSPKQRKEKKLFRKLFPTVIELFEDVKSISNKELAFKLQRLESDLILNKVCKELSKNYPLMPLFTIHDNVVTTLGNEDIVKEAIKRHYENELGVAPEINFERWVKDDLHKISAAA